MIDNDCNLKITFELIDKKSGRSFPAKLNGYLLQTNSFQMKKFRLDKLEFTLLSSNETYNLKLNLTSYDKIFDTQSIDIQTASNLQGK